MSDKPEHDQDDTRDEQDVPRRRYSFARGDHRPVKLAIAAVLVGLQGVGGVVWGGSWFWLAVSGEPTDERASTMGSVLIVLVSALLVRFAVGLWQVDAWPRVPCIVFALICVPIGYQLAFNADLGWIGIPVLASAIAIIVLLFSEDVRNAYGRDV